MTHLHRVRPGCFAIVLLPVATFVFHHYLNAVLGVPDLPIGAEILREDAAHLEAAGRTRFLASFWLFLVIVLVCVLLFFDEWRSPLTEGTRRVALIAVAVVMAPVLLSVWGHQTNPDAARGFDRLGRAVYEAALAQGRVAGCERADAVWLLGRCGDNPVFTMLLDMLDVINLLSALGVGVLACGVVLCLREAPQGSSLEAEVRLLHYNRTRMRVFLYMSGLMLSAGVFLAIGWLHWPLPVVKEDMRKEFETLLRSTELMMGVYFSLLTVSYYGPAVLVHEAKVRALARRAMEDQGPYPDFEAWKEETRLTFDLQQLLRDSTAVIAPVITAFAGGFSPLLS
ncbi:hypothetical protein KUH32_14160 [Thalassococcus sp. CAU 1522]|uniref:Uncharacterized protein n=1 Tax=Thalassococcus arenae TaxID=2851652 RepID=A0ABS6NA53_9RHOB|nr:hypothetical protein [Thalassococcus arenae]MBV2360908.1 hypothetical protein [Thalassococcus arenae]